MPQHGFHSATDNSTWVIFTWGHPECCCYKYGCTSFGLNLTCILSSHVKNAIGEKKRDGNMGTSGYTAVISDLRKQTEG